MARIERRGEKGRKRRRLWESRGESKEKPLLQR
jgi:hypothetical protein